MASKGGSAAEKHCTGLAQLDEDEELDEASAAALPPSLLASAAGASADFLPMSELELGAEIGHGGFSRVYRGKWTPGAGAAAGGGPREVAIKRMPLVDKDAMKYLNSELAILKCVASPRRRRIRVDAFARSKKGLAARWRAPHRLLRASTLLRARALSRAGVARTRTLSSTTVRRSRGRKFSL